MAYAVLRFRGVSSQDIRIFSPDSSPEASWHAFVKNINQKTLRSESVAHFFPTDSPGLATYESLKNWSIKPLIYSWFDQYHPTVEFFVQHVRSVARATGFLRASTPCRVARIEKQGDSFHLFEEGSKQPCTIVRHLILAIGHGPITTPDPIAQYQAQYPYDTHVASAFSQKNIRPGATVIVIGDGLTAATEWMNILENGGKVIAVSMRGFTFNQPLNTPRRYFSTRGFIPYRTLPDAQRLQTLRDATKGTIPGYRYWNKMFAAAVKNETLQLIQGSLQEISQTEGRVRCMVQLPKNASLLPLEADYLISATGFAPVTTHPLLSQLIKQYNLETIDTVLKVDESFAISKLSSDHSLAFVIGPAAGWSLPCADSVGGMKITARTIADRLLGSETFQWREVAFKGRQWLRLMTRKELI